MEASLRLPHKGLSQREHQRIQLYELPRLPQNQKFSRGNEDSCCHFCAIDVAHGIIVENRHMKHCHHFYLLPQKGQLHTVFLQRIAHEVPITYPGTWGTCISSLSFETLDKGMKSVIIHHPDA